MNVTKQDDYVVMETNSADRDLLVIMGLQFCLTSGINEINGKDIKVLAETLLEKIINE